jgi:hypothetical protein
MAINLTTNLTSAAVLYQMFSVDLSGSGWEVMLTYRKWVTSHVDLSGKGSELILTYQDMGHKSCWLIRIWVTNHVDLSGNEQDNHITKMYYTEKISPIWNLILDKSGINNGNMILVIDNITLFMPLLSKIRFQMGDIFSV